MKQPSLMDKQFGSERMYENTPRRLFKILILMLLTIVVFGNWIAVAMAADNVNLTLEGHFGGVTYATDVSGNYAYIGQGQDLVILDISNVSQPSELGRICTGDFVSDIKISGSYAYVVDEYDGLVIIDISNPAAPALAGSYDTAGSAYGVAVSGSYAYVADLYDGLVIIDISNTAAPVLAGSYDTAGRAYGVAVSGSYAYVADYANGLVIIDISNPAAPVLAGSYDTAGVALDVAVSGSYAYVADEYNGLVIIDISNPAAPALAGSYDTARYAYGVAVSGSYAYVADSSNGLVIIDISNPAAPVLAGSYDTAGSALGVAVSGSYAYVADSSNGLVIIDISNPAAPVLAGSYDTAGWAYGVAVSGSYAYVADFSNGLVIIDISNLAALVLAGSYDTAGRAYGVAVSGSYAYVADSSNGLVIIDISNPAAPTLAGSYDTAGDALGVAVSGSYAYVADFSNSLVIIDISNPAAPALAGSYDTAGYSYDVAVSGSYAYVADSTNGLVIIDISNPAAPVLAGSYDTAGSALGVAVSGNYAYVVDGYNGLVIIDISNPAAPALAGNYDTAGYAKGVAVSGNHAYVADSSNGLVIIDISNTAAPALAGSYDTAGDARGVAVSGSYAYVADSSNGLVILNTGLSGTTPAASTASLSTTLSSTYALGEPVTLSTTVKNTGTEPAVITLEITTTGGYSKTIPSTIPAGSTHTDAFNLGITSVGTQTATIKLYRDTTLLETKSKTFTVNDPTAVKFVEDDAESLKKAAIDEFDEMALIPASASSQMITDFGIDKLKNYAKNHLKSPTQSVKSKDTSGTLTDSDMQSMLDSTNGTLDSIEGKIDGTVSKNIIHEINSKSGTNIDESISIFDVKGSVTDIVFENIKDRFNDLLTGTIKDYVIKPVFTQAEEDKVIIRDENFDTYAHSTPFTLTPESKTDITQRFNAGKESISSVTESKALFTIGPYEIPFVGTFSYSVTLKEEENKFHEIDSLKGLLGTAIAAIAVLGVVLALLVSILGSGGTILIPLISALPSIISWIKTITTIIIPVLMSLMTVGMVFTVPIIAPEVTFQHDQTLETIEGIIASESSAITISKIITSSGYVNSPSLLKIEFENKENIAAQPITETMIYSPDGRIIDIQRNDPYIKASSTTTIDQKLSIPSKPGTYKVLGMVHAGAVATSIAQQEMAVTMPALVISMSTDSGTYSIGDTVTISANFTNNEVSDISNLIYVLEVMNTTSVAADMMTLSASSALTKTLAFTPDSEGAYIAKATLLLGLTEVATKSIGFTVGNGEGMLVTATSDTLYPPEADITIPVTIENIGTVYTNSVINVTTYDQLSSGFTQVYANEISLSLAASASTTLDMTVLPAATPGIYRTIILAENYSAESFEYTVTANGTIYTLLDTDKVYYNQTEQVTINTTVNDILFNATNATVTTTVSDPAGNVTSLTVSGSLGHYTSVYAPPINGTYEISASSTRPGFRSYDDETFVIVGERSVLNTTIDTNAFIHNESSTIGLHITNELAKPVVGSIVTLSGSGVNSTKITDSNGNVSFMVTPTQAGTVSINIEKGGYATYSQTLNVVEGATVNIMSPADGTVVGTVNVTISGTANYSSGIASVFVNGVLASGTTNWNADITLVNGTNTITAVATDNAGKTATDVITINCIPSSTTSYTYSMSSGWNMVSLPVTPTDTTVAGVFGSSAQTVYGWTGTAYKLIGAGDNLEPMQGYWVLTNGAATPTVTGIPISSTNHTLVSGWNMAGPVSASVNVSFLEGVTTVYGWSGSAYVLVTGTKELETTKGYWMLVNAETEVNL